MYRKKSTHRVEVVPVKLENHPNADSLSIVRIHGYTVCVRTDDWKDRHHGAYVVPDSIVPNRGPFTFLFKPEDSPEDTRRIKAVRLRGIISQGLLVPAPEGSSIGDDVSDILGVKRYEPPIPLSAGGESEKGPSKFSVPKYDLESWHRYGHVFEKGELVVVTEKLHGANGKWVYAYEYASNGYRMFCGSRTEWKRKDDKNMWWQALEQNPWLQEFCEANPDKVVYGEVYGSVQKFTYGVEKGSGVLKVAVFDIYEPLDTLIEAWRPLHLLGMQIPKTEKLQRVPRLFVGAYNSENIQELAKGPSQIAGSNNIREGLVIEPYTPRYEDEIGRLKLKLVSDDYLAMR